MQVILTGPLGWHKAAGCFGSELRAAAYQLQASISNHALPQ